MAYTRREKNNWALFLLLLAGIVLGSFFGELAEGSTYFNWLNYGGTFGMNTPFNLNLGVILLEFKIAFDITIASLLGIAIAIFVYRKI
ncbi:uncharacterized protein DUF4321 [Natranaerovirga hydrolytica]|uniref:Uncharacterized protein DUF4321 n=1 Tax=Natranaerovirga hydrolytica TaxID=680378 RepID=A0A4R1N627_9FIRM|nr:DUF4321 domain-containing protein [Natranaerovirga hydrolytica]TCK98083.1 uncharacterized protein DUF4321 [Natranaerovirga hydrolytica]